MTESGSLRYYNYLNKIRGHNTTKSLTLEKRVYGFKMRVMEVRVIFKKLD